MKVIPAFFVTSVVDLETIVTYMPLWRNQISRIKNGAVLSLLY